VAVLFHEAGHALAVWLFGGQVEGFTYRFFWGMVEHSGQYTAPQYWFIALAGTLASLLVGLAFWRLLHGNRSPALRYFGLRAFRFQIYFSLLYYPLFSAVLPIGDWRVIYDFAATPWLSGLTLVVHITFLVFYWRYDRQGAFEEPAHETVAAQLEFEALVRETAVANPNPQRYLYYIEALRRGDAPNRARTALHKFIRANPTSAEAYLQLAVLEDDKQRAPSRHAAHYAEKALQLGLTAPMQRAIAHQLVAAYQLEMGQVTTAVQSYTHAITAIQSENYRQRPLANLYRWRGLAYRRQQQYDAAFQDLRQAMTLATQLDDEALTAVLQDDLAILQTHAHRRE
jgi:tetratricopeptide (TPR) repeat protein